MDICKFWVRNAPDNLINKNIIDYGNECKFEFLDKEVRDTLSFAVDCEERCSQGLDYDDEEYDACLEECNKLVEVNSRGAIYYKEDGTVKDALIPTDCSLFEKEDEFGEPYLDISDENIRKISKKFERIGCEELEVADMMHPHEFASTTAGSEPEENQIICYLHVRGKHKGCKLDDLLDTIYKNNLNVS